MPRPRIVVVGSSNTDMVVRSPELPRPGQTVLGGEFLVAAGGKGANQAVAAARAGGDVTFVACIGDDDLGRSALEGFRKDGIRTEFVRIVKGVASGVALILVAKDGENLISVAPGANAKLSPADVDRAERTIARADCLLVQLEVPLPTVKRALQLARRHGVMTILNPAPAARLPKSLLRFVDILTPNRSELAQVGQAFLPVTTKLVVTLGALGSEIRECGRRTRIRAFKVKAVDAVAAGDCFSGALAVALSEGRSLPDSARFASVAAAISVTRKGAQPSLPQRGEIERLLRGWR